jgi:hypothetical protein
MNRSLIAFVVVSALTSVSQAQTLCPDGSFVNGPCRMAPNGTFVGSSGDIQMAPNGSFVAGTPRMAPNGTFVGGNGQMTLCPDGSYVSGQCVMAPNGRFIGR